MLNRIYKTKLIKLIIAYANKSTVHNITKCHFYLTPYPIYVSVVWYSSSVNWNWIVANTHRRVECESPSVYRPILLIDLCWESIDTDVYRTSIHKVICANRQIRESQLCIMYVHLDSICVQNVIKAQTLVSLRIHFILFIECVKINQIEFIRLLSLLGKLIFSL